MLPKTEKDIEIIERAKNLQVFCWGEVYERMISGMLYDISSGLYPKRTKLQLTLYRHNPLAPELIEGRSRARHLMAKFNAPLSSEAPDSEVVTQRENLLQRLFGHVGKGIYIEPPLTWITAATSV